MMKYNYILLVFLMWTVNAWAQEKSKAKVFLEQFAHLEGKYFEGKIIAGSKEGDGFTGKKLLMQVLSYEDRQVKIPFYVGDDKSRTWILTFSNEALELKHDHRHEDGTPDKVTYYGGTATNSGSDTIQIFPADVETCQLIDFACQNVWWITMDGKKYTYNLRRIGSDRLFSVEFDLTKPVESDFQPW